jgi:hypothetical protein
MNRCFYQHPPLDWQSVLDETCRKWRTKKLQGVLCKLILSSTVYHIWRTRNEIKAKGHPKTEEQNSYLKQQPAIWKTCMNRCFYQRPPLDWKSVLDEACRKWRTKKLQGVLCKLILSFTVYHIWCTRNEIKAKGHLKTEEQILRLIF